MKHRGLKFLSLLLTLVMLIGVLPGMSAYAWSPYGLKVGDDDVNDSKLSGDGWSFIPATNTLTLSDANIGGQGIQYTGNSTLNIVLSGTNSVSVTSGFAINIIGSGASLTISGTGSLTISSSANYGIYSRGAIEISGGTVTATASQYAIGSNTDITISGGTVTGTATTATGSGSGIYAFGKITINNGGTVTAEANQYGIRAYNMLINDGTVTGKASNASRNCYGIYVPQSIEISGGTLTAEGTGNNSVGIRVFDGITINGGIVTAKGSIYAIAGSVKNSMPGTGWTNTAGTEGKTTIAVNTEGQDLKEPEYKKVQFPAAADSFTVTYVANNGTDQKAEDGPHEAGSYTIQAYDKNFTAPDGQVFVCWKDGNGTEYKNEQIINLSANLTLYAQWKPASQGVDSEGGGSGSFVDLVFNIPGVDNSWEYAPGYAPQQAYRVSLAPMQGGSAALGLTTGDSGTALNVYPTSAVYVFPNADPGYTLDKIVWSLIDGSASYDITEAKNFVMPAMDVVVYVTFRPVG